MRRATALALLLLTACSPAKPPPAAPSPTPPPSSPSPSLTPGLDLGAIDLGLEKVVDGLERPVFVTDAGDGSGRLYVIEQYAGIRVIEPDGRLLPEPFLDLSGKVATDNEQGVLGLAFHPLDPARFFVNITNTEGDTVIAEYRTLDPASADPASRRVLLRVDQPYANHNGGMLAFGPDGYLYASLGDGGSGGDPHGNGQSLKTLLGKILRIDVDGDEPYSIPPENPFVDRGRPEIWAYGLRNPWRFSFDRATGDLWIGDVGQGETEEVDVLPGGAAGANLGWNKLEGSGCYASGECDPSGTVLPVAEYPTSQGCAVTGGYVYRGVVHPALVGAYLYADYCGGQIWGLNAARAVDEGRAKPRLLLRSGLNVSSFGEDETGELYVTDLNGGVYRLTAS